MRYELLEILACPACGSSLQCAALATPRSEITDGTLECLGCGESYPVINGIPRFVAPESYASSFGFQWNRFREEQLDMLNGTGQSWRRFFEETQLNPERLRGLWLLEGGCGAGRFLDVASQCGAEVVGIDLTNAVDAAKESLGSRSNVHLVQASLYELPFKPNTFDGCYSIGVIQHTPDPEAALGGLPAVVKPGGCVAVTIYERKRYTRLNGKYLIRPITRRLNDRLLLTLIRTLMPIAFAMTEVLYRIPVLGRVFKFIIPVANHVEKSDLSLRQRYAWAVLDTFDMLAPRYDQPQREQDVRRALGAVGVGRIDRTAAPGLNLVGCKEATDGGPPL